MTQALASFLFFYVFGLLAIVLTWYIVWSLYRYSKEQHMVRSIEKDQQEQPKK